MSADADFAVPVPANMAYRCEGIEGTFNTFISNALFLAFIGFQIQQNRPTFTLLLTLFSIGFGVIGYLDYNETLALCHFERPNIFLAYFILFGVVEATILGITIAEFFIPTTSII